MKLISYSDIQFINTVNSLSSKIESIGTVPTAADMGESNVDAMKKFIELYELMGLMMQEYKELLDLDQDSLKKVGVTMKLQDLDVMKLWR